MFSIFGLNLIQNTFSLSAPQYQGGNRILLFTLHWKTCPTWFLLGSEAVDGPLGEIVDYVIRDYIHSWYNNIASSDKV